MKVESIILKENQLTEYVVNNFEEGAIVEISYNRVFVPGKIVHVYDDATVTIQLMGELLNQRVDIDFNEVKHELLEIVYTFKDKSVTLILED
ncbi:MAG: DUF2097 domain-containing protein [Methanosphaera sp.]|uniref:DUF2097 domain-containing protein n=1 Tax=Methanosphaera sp. ISO3-F5 TaxID=1452353 RepID=UPI002B263808|nr:DUF2097 domain-containing protein [Methanosphaera sp. ISO3-F5]MBR0471224.1 DUF2097 domain-containing protein [Methanosphaera sp.]WQH65143.1 DUF2097 domain-containing protein [Methanosphaera sp. ISO3-F5]